MTHCQSIGTRESLRLIVYIVRVLGTHQWSLILLGSHMFLTSFSFLTCFCSIFGHFSHRSEWQLVKIDFRPIFQHRCTSEDYETWQLNNKAGVKNVSDPRGKKSTYMSQSEGQKMIAAAAAAAAAKTKKSTIKGKRESWKCLPSIIHYRVKSASWE